MRITGHRMLELAAAAQSRAQEDVAAISGELTSGRRVAAPSDDPLAWAQARRAEVRRAAAESRGEAFALGKHHLAETERALASLGDLLAQAQELAVQAANDSLGAGERAAIGVRVAGLYQSALAAADTRTVSGEGVLADQAQRVLALDDGVTSTAAASLPGDRLTAVGGSVDVLPMLSQFAAALSINDTVAIRAAVGDLATAHAQVTRARSDTGAMYAVLDDAEHAGRQLQDTMTAHIASLTDSDVVGAASELARRANALGVSEAVHARLAALLSPAR